MIFFSLRFELTSYHVDVTILIFFVLFKVINLVELKLKNIKSLPKKN